MTQDNKKEGASNRLTREELRASLPQLIPPLSRTVIDGRQEASASFEDREAAKGWGYEAVGNFFAFAFAPRMFVAATGGQLT
jgi:hypothetical protein